MSEYYLNTENINEWVENLVAGDRVLLSGTVYTARDAAHKRIKELIFSEDKTPFDIENSVTAKAQRIEYDQEKEIAILQIEVNLTQKENECLGAYAIYHKKDQVLEISGNAQVKQKQDTFRAQNIHFNMETEEIKLGGNVKGSVTEKKDKEQPKEELQLQTDKKTE